jgi:signal peptidase II
MNRSYGTMVLAGAVVVLDQATKLLVRQRFAPFDSVQVIPGFFDLARVHNTGAAFGMLNGVDLPYKTALLALVAVAALIGLTVFAASLPSTHWLARVGVPLVVGGAVGNLIDRLTLGYVVDFLDFYWRGWHFWAFNVADAAITVGMALIILDQIGAGHRVSRAV